MKFAVFKFDGNTPTHRGSRASSAGKLLLGKPNFRPTHSLVKHWKQFSGDRPAKFLLWFFSFLGIQLCVLAAGLAAGLTAELACRKVFDIWPLAMVYAKQSGSFKHFTSFLQKKKEPAKAPGKVECITFDHLFLAPIRAMFSVKPRVQILEVCVCFSRLSECVFTHSKWHVGRRTQA